MDTIRNYLESMFASLPNTPEVRRAKEELGQMMEDKFSELRNQGAGENEAVATVISEFGNLNEIASDLGLHAIARKNTDGRFIIDMDVATDYLFDANTFALRISLGVALFILCPIMPIVGGFGLVPMTFSLAAMFIMIFLGIFMLIYGGIDYSKWSYLKKNSCVLDYPTYDYIKNESNKYSSTFSLRLTLGVMLCCMCWFPLVILTNKKSLLSQLLGYSTVLGLVLLFSCIGVGVMLIIMAGIIKGTYSKLLKINSGNVSNCG